MCTVEPTVKPGQLPCLVLALVMLTSGSSFVSAYQQSLKLHEHLATNRVRFSHRLNEMSDELLSLAREGEKMRKLVSLDDSSSVQHEARRLTTLSTRRTGTDIRLPCKTARR